jgi:serine-type D-Ala-D-Ala carboxypeptidase/endopeptidase (penicillin-binding protein 4)
LHPSFEKLFRIVLFASVFSATVGISKAYAEGSPSSKLAAPFEAFRKAGIPLADVSLYAVPVEQGEAVIAHNAESAFVLASTAKLFTAMAALDILGSGYRWRTTAYLNGKLGDGVLTGDLLIVGGGDPMLSSEKLVSWFQLMQKRGVKQIVGNIVLDRRQFAFVEGDHANTPVPAWHNPHHAQPDALVIDEGVVKVNIGAGPQGKTIVLEPAIEGIEIVDQSKTVAKCSAVKKPLEIEFEESSQNHKLVISGDWAQDCPAYKLATSPWDQTEFSRAAVLAAWIKSGGALSGTVVEAPPLAKPLKSKRPMRVAKAPRPRKPFLTLDSKPLVESVRETNKWSNNLISRHLLLSLSKGFPREVATLRNAQQVLAQWLLQKGITAEDVTLENGSGLSRNERAKARTFATLLKEAWSTKYHKDFKDSFPIVGVDGTMGSRLKRSLAAGKALIKTGTLNDVRSVAGYVTTKDNKTYAMVAIVNHAHASRAVPALDAFIEWLQATP